MPFIFILMYPRKQLFDKSYYKDREGMVTHIDDAGQIHGTWGFRYAFWVVSWFHFKSCHYIHDHTPVKRKFLNIGALLGIGANGTSDGT